MTFLYIVIAILILLVLITLHELGHFIAGKLLHFKINEFSVGIGPAILKKEKKDGTIISLRAIPLGGYCAFASEEEVEVTRFSSETSASEALDYIPFEKQPAYKRFIVLLSGALTNFLTAFIFMLVFILFSGYGIPVVNSVMTDSNGIKYNESILEGDKIIAVNGRDIHVDYSFSNAVESINEGEHAIFTIDRNGDIINAEVEKKSIESDSGNYPGFGITLLYERNQVSFLDALIKTPSTTFQMVGAVFNSFGMLFSGQVSIRDISGPIGTIHYISEYAQTNWLYILLFLPLLSVNLAVFNILPIPSLDGARILFLLIEVIRRKPINKEIESRINSIGLIILFLFIIMVDIVNLLLA